MRAMRPNTTPASGLLFRKAFGGVEAEALPVPVLVGIASTVWITIEVDSSRVKVGMLEMDVDSGLRVVVLAVLAELDAGDDEADDEAGLDVDDRTDDDDVRAVGWVDIMVEVRKMELIKGSSG